MINGSHGKGIGTSQPFILSPGLQSLENPLFSEDDAVYSAPSTPPSPTRPTMRDDNQLPSLKNLTLVVYALQAASFAFGVTAIVAVIINYVKLDDVQGTWLASHFRWQIRTFWFSLLWCGLGLTTFLLVIGYGILLADGVWVIYRVVKGGLNLFDGKPMYTVTAPVQQP